MIERLREYVERDEIYQSFKHGELKDSELSDFDKFCIKHCEDIEELLKRNKELEEGIKAFSDDLCEEAEAKEKLQQKIDKAINYFEEYTYTYETPKRCTVNVDSKHIVKAIKILKGEDNE